MVDEGRCVTVKTKMFDAKSAGNLYGNIFSNIKDSEVFCNNIMWYENRMLGREESDHNDSRKEHNMTAEIQLASTFMTM